MTEAQINDNVKAKNNNKKADSKDYENVEIITAGLLQGEIFQGNVNFQISPDLLQSNISNQIKQIEIDFQDGKGYRVFDFKEQLIPYQFTTIGDVAIAIKLVTKRGTFLTYNILTIHQLERPQPYMSKKTVNAIKVVQESVKNGRVEQNVVGGEYQIYTGCDGVFDKPIIIAEGFDIGQDVNISDMVAKYYPYLYAFRNHGYDLVFVNYSDGRDYMQNNAEVLKRVINEVNSIKVGNNKLVVIGESMSGLIARWALRSMENAGQTHNVSHYIAFDTPHQGANVPPGLVALGRNLYGHTGGFFSLLVALLVPEVMAIYSPAACQLLIHQSSTLEKHPLFDSFRQDLKNLGNGGYPNQGGIRNIALVNGSLNGTPNRNYTNGVLNPGDKILDVDVVGILCNSFIDAWSNQVGQSTKVYDGDAIGICNISFSSSYVNFNRNLDRTPGGYISSGLGYGFPIYSTTNPSFSFVPTFSSIDYRGSLVNDNDYTFPISGSIINASTFQTINTNLTPFAAIYGDDFNNEHARIRGDLGALNTLALRENFGITNTEAVLANCSLPIPPKVMQTGTYFKVGRKNNVLPSGLCKASRGYKFTPQIMTIDLIIPNSNTTSNYVQSIRITGGNLTSPLILQANSWNIYTLNYTNLSTGTYTITTVRRFYGSNTQESTNSTTIQISGSCRLAAGDCPEDDEEGAEIGILSDVNLPCYASKYNGIWVASLEDGTFIPRSRLIANGMNTNSANCFAETDPSSNVVINDNCYTIQSKQTNNYMQLMSDGTIQQQVANNQTTQIWKAVTSGSSYQFVSQSNQQYLKVDNYNEGTHVTSGTSGNNLWNLENSSGSYRVSTPTGITWDMEGYGTGQYLQLYGSTSESLGNHRLWNFTQTTCNTPSTLSLSQSSWSPSASSNSTSVSINSNVSWTASSNQIWLTVSPTSGSNNGTLTLTATANTDTYARTGTITVTGGGISQSVAVTQAGTTASTCPADEVVVGNQGGGEVVIKHFDNYYILCTKSVSGSVTRYVPRGKNYWTWSGFTKNSNVDQYYSCINVNDSDWWGLANPLPSGYVPTGWLSSTFNDADGNPVFYFYKNTTNTLSLSLSTWSTVAASGSTTVNVSSNVSWTASSNQIWLTVSPTSGSNNGTLTLTATANTATSARTGTITVTGGGFSQTVTVTQAGTTSTGSCAVNKVRLLFRADCCLDRLVGAKIRGSNDNSNWTDIYTFTANGTGSWQEFTFSNSTIYQYVRFEASASGYGELFELEFYNGTTKLTGTGFGGTSALDGDIYTFWHGGNMGSINYAGIQINTTNCTTNTLSLSQSSWSTSASNTSTTVSVSSNVSWTASSNATGWLSVSPASGSNNGTLTLTATANSGGSRTGTITVSGGGLSQAVTVTQAAGSSCGNTPQNYCLTGTIPTNQFRYLSNNAYTNVAGPKNSLDGGSPPFYGNAGWIQGYNGVSGSIIYPTNQNDINLPVVSSGYRIDLWWPSANSKVLKLYVNGVQKWSQTTTCQDYCQFYPDFSTVVSGDRVYFEVTENATARVAVSNDVFEKQEEVKDDVLVVSPNPTDGKVKASFYVREAQSVRLSVIDTQGRIVRIYDKDADVGANNIDLDLEQQASGTYIIQLQLNNKQLVTKVIRL
ncbi:BACON domain-containing protein [Arcicella lustrica]|uniref:BACON domain-containing carbohydrate-binding protein n=1 Tax=Arcicella lustrica TaxID=2984196 RepID=A0ABU5SHU1_9BACT|nr:BACON domain-containing carbohydrate-binding protein [Arcicella sp. DC25W]MEA5426844.1 BACON domain-containing carbohydrate-binding protein [Arcicella sp. DC25W]